MISDFLLIIQGHDFYLDKDKWVWKFSRDGNFSMSYAYHRLLDSSNAPNISSSYMAYYLILIWCRWVPSKVLLFSWKLHLDRFPSRVKLFKIKVIAEVILTICSPLCGDSS